MNPELENLESLLDELLKGIQDVLQSGEVLTDEFQGMLAEELVYLTDRIDEIQQDQVNQPEPPQELPQNIPLETPISDDIRLLWILSGENEQSFIQYLNTFPSTSTQNLLRNPDELQRTIADLQQSMPGNQIPIVIDGIPNADLNSSNVYGYRYNPETGKLKVRFQGGSVYEYDKVPPNLFNAFKNGAASARTSGQNNYGRWWVGKNPSLGAAFWNYIRNAGFNYRRLR